MGTETPAKGTTDTLSTMPPLLSHDGHGEVDEKNNMDAGEIGGDVVDAVGGEGYVAVRSEAVERIFRNGRPETGCVLASMHDYFTPVETCEFDDEGEGCWVI